MRTMNIKWLSILLNLALASLGFAQGVSIKAVPATPNRIIGHYRNASGPATPGGQHDALVQRTDMVFPHIATGGGWETVMVIVNISSQPVDFVQKFFDESGAPMNVTFRTFPEGIVITAPSTSGHLGPLQSFNFALLDATPDLQVGWASLEYDSTNARLGGYEAFRLKAGGVINEGLVPLASYADIDFDMPFDNIEGFATGLALANPASNLTNHVHIVAYDLNGNRIATLNVSIPPNGHFSGVLADLIPSLDGVTGTLSVSSDLTVLSAVGIRMNVAQGYTFASIPVMNFIPGI